MLVKISFSISNLVQIDTKFFVPSTLVLKYSDTKNGANPGLVFFESDNIPSEFIKFSKLALWQLINRNNAKIFAKKNNLEIHYQGNGQGSWRVEGLSETDLV